MTNAQRIRDERGLSLRKVAAHPLVTCNHVQVLNCERDITRGSIWTLVEIAAAYDLPFDLVWGDQVEELMIEIREPMEEPDARDP